MIILGLDISTTATGIAVLKDGVLVYSEVVKTSNRKQYEDLYDISDAIRDTLMLDVDSVWNVDRVFVEENAISFSRGKSTANTIAKLAKINAMVSLTCRDVFGLKPHAIMPSSARKKVGVKIVKKTTPKEKKMTILNWVVANEPSFSYTLTPKGNPKPGTFDRSDAIVIARAGEKIVETET